MIYRPRKRLEPDTIGLMIFAFGMGVRHRMDDLRWSMRDVLTCNRSDEHGHQVAVCDL
jgi:hypothetical protein